MSCVCLYRDTRVWFSHSCIALDNRLLMLFIVSRQSTFFVPLENTKRSPFFLLTHTHTCFISIMLSNCPTVLAVASCHSLHFKHLQNSVFLKKNSRFRSDWNGPDTWLLPLLQPAILQCWHSFVSVSHILSAHILLCPFHTFLSHTFFCARFTPSFVPVSHILLCLFHMFLLSVSHILWVHFTLCRPFHTFCVFSLSPIVFPCLCYQCLLFFQFLSNSGKWTPEEDIRLACAVQSLRDPQTGKVKWTEVQRFVGGRTDVKCRERWCSSLDPALAKNTFTQVSFTLIGFVINLLLFLQLFSICHLSLLL